MDHLQWHSSHCNCIFAARVIMQVSFLLRYNSDIKHYTPGAAVSQYRAKFCTLEIKKKQKPHAGQIWNPMWLRCSDIFSFFSDHSWAEIMFLQSYLWAQSRGDEHQLWGKGTAVMKKGWGCNSGRFCRNLTSRPHFVPLLWVLFLRASLGG